MSFLNWLLLGICVCFTIASFATYKSGYAGRGVVLLMGAAGSLRIILIGLDPFLHDWDERFHALVAKNMQANFLLPVLRATPVLPYDYRSWSTNHVWLHKQPLFLWQMALSLKAFGVNETALRFPSALLGTLLLWPVYRLGRLACSPAVGYHAALLLAFAYYQLELTTGWQSVDHSDVAFLAYVTASIWAYYEARSSPASTWGWHMAVGMFAGAAMLCKWLPGLIVYAVWTVELLIERARRQQVQEYKWLICALAITSLVALPWQLYIHFQFPLESAFEAQYAAQHFSHVLEDHGGSWHFYLLQNMWYQYQWLVLLVGVGIGLLFTSRIRLQPMRPLLMSCILMFIFYSLAATKMPSYTYVVAPGVLILASIAWVAGVEQFGRRIKQAGGVIEGVLLVLVITLDLRATSLLKHHTMRFANAVGQLERRTKIERTAVFRRLDALVPSGYIVVNVPVLTETEAMFYSQRNVYPQWPSETQYRGLRRHGLHFATFPIHSDQVMPAFLHKDGVLLIPANLE